MWVVVAVVTYQCRCVSARGVSLFSVLGGREAPMLKALHALCERAAMCNPVLDETEVR